MRGFKIIKQHDTMECGIATLAMICSYYGKEINVSYLSNLCTTTHEGTSLKGISDAAEKIGFESISGYLSIEQLKRFKEPLIIHWHQNHFVILYKISKDGKTFFIADPARGKLKYSQRDFEKNWCCDDNNLQNKGIAMYLSPTPLFYEHKEEKGPGHSLKFLYSYISVHKKYFIQIFLGLLLTSLLQLCFPFLTQWIVDFGIINQDIRFVWLVLIGELLIILGTTSSDFIRRWLLLHIAMRINLSLVSDFLIKLLKLPMSFFDSKMTGDILQRINDHSRVQSFLTDQTLDLTFSLLNFVVFGCVLLLYNLYVFLIFLGGGAVYGMWILLFLKKRRKLDFELFEHQATNHNKTYQFVSSIQEIKLQDCEKRRRWDWEDTQAELFKVKMKTLKMQQAQEAGSIFINGAKNIFITIFTATTVIHGEMTLGVMLAIQYIIGQLNAPMEQLMHFIYSIQDVKISLERINEIHTGGTEENTISTKKSFDKTNNIVIQDVDFKYDLHKKKKTLEKVSFEIREGEVTAIVGTSGSGKTTLIKLMLGYYKVLSGNIMIAGSNINDYNLKWWRQHCGVVMQDGVIFSESIERNIAINDGEIDRQRLIYAAKIANIHDYIMSLPLKYATRIGADGMGLSQGQKQRILIARAVYKHPNFIFLDEATNALDARNERCIVENLSEFYRGKTVVIVAHRLSTVKNADNIVVLDNGKVVETGTHNELIKNKGAYYNLVKNQLELGN